MFKLTLENAGQYQFQLKKNIGIQEYKGQYYTINLETGDVYRPNESGSIILSCCAPWHGPCSVDDFYKYLNQYYLEAKPEQKTDIVDFLNQLLEMDLVEVVEGPAGTEEQ
jgi:hypothetical protein